eukprot:scaffold31480_cov76-Phaeocystis_antarctica.AAC.1
MHSAVGGAAYRSSPLLAAAAVKAAARCPPHPRATSAICSAACSPRPPARTPAPLARLRSPAS